MQGSASLALHSEVWRGSRFVVPLVLLWEVTSGVPVRVGLRIISECRGQSRAWSWGEVKQVAASSLVIARYSLLKLALATSTFVLLSAVFLFLIFVTAAGDYRGRYDGAVVLAFSIGSLPLSVWLSSIGLRRWINSGFQRVAIVVIDRRLVLNETKRSVFEVREIEAVMASEYDPGKIYLRLKDGRKRGVRVSLMKEARMEIVADIESAMASSA